MADASIVTMQLVPVDVAPALVAAWAQAFGPFPEVRTVCDDILAVAEGAVVSPANGSGYMDGGLDLAFGEFFGLELQGRVMDAIGARPEGLPVGAAIVVPTGNERIKHLVVAPTMAGPGEVPAANSYHSMAAALRVASKRRLPILFCPGLGTGVGAVPFEAAAGEMASAYGRWRERQASA